MVLISLTWLELDTADSNFLENNLGEHFIV